MNSTDASGAIQPEGTANIEDEMAAAEAELKAAQARLDELKAKAVQNDPAPQPSPEAPSSEAPALSPEVSPSEAPALSPEASSSEVSPSEDPSPSPEGPVSSPESSSPEAPAPSPESSAQHSAAAQNGAPYQPPMPQGYGAYQQGQPYQQPTCSYQQPAYTYQQPNQPPYNQPSHGQSAYVPPVAYSKDHVAAGLLAIFLGALGIHKFYMGYNTAGFIMLAVTVAGSILTLGIAAAVMGIIGIVEGILYLTKSQTEFEQIYVFNKKDWF